jgi:UDP-GlcNAc:undecaprenyl-phosphate/decaprenyl-phosphate GlcNAc-1-phosphate transferase
MNEFDLVMIASGLALLITAALIPSWINVCHKWHLFESTDERKRHAHSTPTLGGLAVFAGCMIPFMVFGNGSLMPVLAGCIILFFTGFFDDLISLAAGKKLLLQITAATIIAFNGIRLTDMQGILGLQEIPVWLQYVCTISIIVVITNAFNLIDGIDGLAASIGIIASSIFGYIFFKNNMQEHALMAFSLSGALLGFLIYNFHPARIFMGDTGSLICGFMLSVFAVTLLSTPAQGTILASPSLILTILFIPLYDVIRVMAIRMITGKSPFEPDRNHIHHMIMASGFGQRMVTMIIIVFSGFFIGLYFLFPRMNIHLFLLMCTCTAMLLINSTTMRLIGMVYRMMGGKLYVQPGPGMNRYLRKAA